MRRLLWAHYKRRSVIRDLRILRRSGPDIGLMDGRKVDFTAEAIALAKRRWNEATRIVRGQKAVA